MPDEVIFAVPTLFPSASFTSTVTAVAARDKAAPRLPRTTTLVILLRRLIAPFYHNVCCKCDPPRFREDSRRHYDFSPGLLYTVQDRGWLLGLVNFQTDGGDKHPSPDRIENGEFTASRFRLRFDIAGLKSEPKLENGRFAIDLGGAKLYLEIRKAAMSTFEPNVTWGREGNVFAISLDWFAPGEPRKIRWADTGPACAIFTMAMSGPNNPSKNSLALGGRLVPAHYPSRTAPSTPRSTASQCLSRD